MGIRNIHITVPINKKAKNIKENEMEQSKKRKEELCKQFKQKSQQLKNNENITIENNIDMSKVNNISKNNQKKQKELKNKIKNLEQKKSELRNELQKTQIQNKSQKAKIYTLTLQHNKFQEDIDKRDLIIKKLKDEIQNLNAEKQELQSYKENVTLFSLQQEINNLKSKNSRYIVQITQLNTAINKLQNQLINAESLGKVDIGFSYKHKYEQLKKYEKWSKKQIKSAVKDRVGEISKYNYKLSLLNKNLKETLNDMIKYTQYNKAMIFIEYFLSFYCTSKLLPKGKNANQINFANSVINQDIIVFEPLQNELKKINAEPLTNNNEEIEQMRLAEEKNKQTKVNNVIENMRYGYLLLDEDVWRFISTDNEVYEVLDDIRELSMNNMPCKVKIENNKATIIKIYKQSETIQSNVSNKHKQSNIVHNDTINQTIEHYKKIFNGITVLIVGSRNKNKYTAILTMCGVDVLWHNPFEEHSHTLISKAYKSDVIILCANHISHEVLNILNVEDANIQIVYNDSSTRILSRIKYTLVSLGKI